MQDAAAAMGKAGEAFKTLFTPPQQEEIYKVLKRKSALGNKGDRVLDVAAMKANAPVNDMSVTYQFNKVLSKDYKKITEWAADILSSPQKLAQVFSYAAGYPLIEINDAGEQTVIQSAAPYIKIS